MLAGPQIRRLRERQAVPVLFVRVVSGVYAAEDMLMRFDSSVGICSTQKLSRALVDPFSDGLVWWNWLGICYGCYYAPCARA